MSRAGTVEVVCRVDAGLTCFISAASVTARVFTGFVVRVVECVIEGVGARLLVFTCASFPVLLLSWVAMNLAHAENSEDAIKGHRLFFTEAQRKQVTEQISEQSSYKLSDAEAGLETAGKEAHSIAAGETDESLKAPSPESPVSRQAQSPAMAQGGTVDNYQVYFSGLVVGLRGAGVLVNDLPCQFESAAWKRTASEPLSLDCSGVKNEALVLTLLPRSGVLMVSDAGGRVHRLVPGEQW
ncbi:hypothetical protein [Granulosicoccus antarcticus]|uniref:Uncharacterized protein n=1 Tax=Granulosicoccus antarcticus IMCC3135 TaxID=1192854 RepID=A0A2Z2P6A4_9GAMM|nr:hypothetical protein [Granulosicoccus antarcticus]ASJ76237.1 hypothetical protein IMCC3135_30940 [Granulosicoccus antarcticus IMCC3135]